MSIRGKIITLLFFMSLYFFVWLYGKIGMHFTFDSFGRWFFSVSGFTCFWFIMGAIYTFYKKEL